MSPGFERPGLFSLPLPLTLSMLLLLNTPPIKLRSTDFSATKTCSAWRWGDSQSYIQSLQKKVCPPPDDSLSMLHSDLTHLTMLNPSESTATTLSQVT